MSSKQLSEIHILLYLFEQFVCCVVFDILIAHVYIIDPRFVVFVWNRVVDNIVRNDDDSFANWHTTINNMQVSDNNESINSAKLSLLHINTQFIYNIQTSRCPEG